MKSSKNGSDARQESFKRRLNFDDINDAEKIQKGEKFQRIVEQSDEEEFMNQLLKAFIKPIRNKDSGCRYKCVAETVVGECEYAARNVESAKKHIINAHGKKLGLIT